MPKRRQLALAFAVVAGGCLLASARAYAQRPEPPERVLPDYDVRLLAPRVPPALPPDAQALLDGIRANRTDVRVTLHPLTGGVRTLAAGGRPLLGAAAGGPERVARGFLARYHRLLGLDARDLRFLVKTREYRSQGDPLVHVTFSERQDGVDVVGAVVAIHMTPDGAIVSVSNSAVPLADVPAAAVSADAAVQSAIADVDPALVGTPAIVEGPSGPDRHMQYARDGFASPIDARLVIFPLSGGAHPAWRVTLEPTGLPRKYDVYVDAVTGEVLARHNRVLYVQGFGRVLQSDAAAAADARRPDAHPIGSTAPGGGDPPSGCPPIADHLPRSLTAPFRDSATVLFDTGRLSGNNVHVFRGAEGVEGAAGTAQADGWHFDYAFNTADAAETHLFFLGNFLHDFFYDLGFDEAAGNFQADNFGRGGLGGDALVALARANGRNNATFEPNPDGQPSIMSMFLWDGHGCWSQDVDGDGAADIDGDVDADIVIHEFHHGVSNRLNPQFTGIEADAMGEGGSDFFAYSITGDPVLAEYASPPSGIRQINDKTYADWFCLSFFGFVLCEPHSNGEIFADVLWDLRERFRGDGVGGGDAAAVNTVHQLYVDALKLSPPSPTMLDMRDAILAADLVRHPSADPGGSESHCRIWEVFAGRGMGWAARDTNDTGTASVVADVTVAPECPAPPPPQVSVTASPSTATEAGTVPGVFHFVREGDASHSISVHFTVSGTATSGSDYEALPPTITIPAGTASADLAVTPVDDTAVENDETVVLTMTGGLGYQVGSPASATVTIASDDVAADLTVTGLSAPFYLGAGLPFNATGAIVNQGTGAAAPSTARYYLSTDIWFDASDVVLGSTGVPGLGVGASQPFSVTLTVPAATPTGIYYVLARADADEAIAEISETNNVKFAPVRVGPDLLVASLSAPATAAAGSAFVVTDTTKNAGAGNAPGSVLRLYLSSNASLDAADAALGSRTVPALAPNATNTGVTVVTVPASTTSGTYYLIATADADNAVAEVNELNNATWATVKVGPDLVVSNASMTGTPAPGAAITVSDTTKNQGASASAASTTRIYLSADTLPDASDVVLGGRSVPALSAGASSTGATSVTIPSTTATGTYYVLVQADGLATNDETNEANNVRSILVRIGPDLVVSVSAPATAAAGGALPVTDTVRNQGTGPAAASTTRFFLSADLQLDAGDAALGARSVPPLGIGASSTGTTTVTLPGGLATGTYYVIGQADDTGAVAETIETNNTGSAPTRIGPDLVISSVFVTGVLEAGGAFTATDTTRNQGSGGAGTSSTRYYFSTNATLDGSDVLIGSRAVPALAASGSQAGSASLVVPAGTAGGSYFLLAVADGDGTVDETNEANNVWPAVIRVGPDLIVSLLSVPSSAAAGSALTIGDTTKNQAAPASAPTTTRFYLTADFSLDGSDVALGGRTVGPLGTNATSSGTTTVTIPSGTAAGRYYVLAVADGDAELAESNEGNNQVFRAIQVQ